MAGDDPLLDPIFDDRFEIGTAAAPSGWHQHAADPARSSYQAESIPMPWRWKWSWNGPDAQGAIVAGKTSLPRNVQPVTGGGRVYVAAGGTGVVALDRDSGAVIWQLALSGAVVSTPAWRAEDDSLIVVAETGTLYRLNAGNGSVLASAPIAPPARHPPLLLADRVVVASGEAVQAFEVASLAPLWSYAAESLLETPASWAETSQRLVVATADLHVHAIDTSGQRLWRVKPTPRQAPADPDQFEYGPNEASFRHGWPVVVDSLDLVLVKLRLDWQTMWNLPPLTSNAALRQFMSANPDQQALLALNLEDGTQAFISNVPHGGFGNGNYMPMGPQPVVKTLADGSQQVYAIIRGTNRHDQRWDSHFGELMVDDSLPGLEPGDVRWIEYPGLVDYLLTDEQPNLSMAGDQLFGGHWMAGYAIEILDRSPGLGSHDQPITAQPLPHLVTSSNDGSFDPRRWRPSGLYQDGDARGFPFGFHIYWNQGAVYDAYWSEYAVWVVSEGLILFRSTDGAVIALEHGDPLAGAEAPPEALHSMTEPARTSIATPPAARLEWQQTRAHVGQTARVAGSIRSVFNNGKAIQLAFADPHRGHFKILIERADWPRFGPALGTARGADQAGLYFPGQSLTVEGPIDWYQGDPVIRVSRPEQIRVHAD